MERIKETVYIGHNPLSFLDKDPEHWKDSPGMPLVLLGLSDLIMELQDAEDTLKGEDKIMK